MGWGAIQQFILVDAETGELITTYCADRSTVAQNGYWGTETGVGSLDSMREMMRNAQDAEGNAVFTEEGSGIIDSKQQNPRCKPWVFFMSQGYRTVKGFFY